MHLLVTPRAVIYTICRPFLSVAYIESGSTIFFRASHGSAKLDHDGYIMEGNNPEECVALCCFFVVGGSIFVPVPHISNHRVLYLDGSIEWSRSGLY